MKYRVYYMKPDFFRDGCFGRKPNIDDLEATHVFLKETEASHLEALFGQMQGEVWSPNGEARPLIEARGLQHTSMSVGDVAVDPNGLASVVATFGFVQIGRVK